MAEDDLAATEPAFVHFATRTGSQIRTGAFTWRGPVTGGTREYDDVQPQKPSISWLFASLLVLVAISGCVRRRLTVRTNPPGALIYVDRQLIGPSPASTSFIYWGTRHIEAVGDGYRTEKVLRTFYPKWYQIPPLDFFSETLWPWEIRDQRVVDITMLQEPNVPTEELIGRADEMRTQAASGIAVPLTRTQGPPDPPVPQVLPPSNPPPYVPPSESFVPDPGVMPSTVLPPTVNQPWRPGSILRGLLQPGGQPVERIPEAGALQGGGYRPIVP
ncbi:MAG: PEGA domain-containing protein [Pirellulaceae bacterium]|nr:PEGA domain-containing protein [Pirellulaceae bacterium]